MRSAEYTLFELNTEYIKQQDPMKLTVSHFNTSSVVRRSNNAVTSYTIHNNHVTHRKCIVFLHTHTSNNLKSLQYCTWHAEFRSRRQILHAIALGTKLSKVHKTCTSEHCATSASVFTRHDYSALHYYNIHSPQQQAPLHISHLLPEYCCERD